MHEYYKQFKKEYISSVQGYLQQFTGKVIFKLYLGSPQVQDVDIFSKLDQMLDLKEHKLQAKEFGFYPISSKEPTKI